MVNGSENIKSRLSRELRLRSLLVSSSKAGKNEIQVIANKLDVFNSFLQLKWLNQ